MLFIIAQICGLINFITYGASIWMKKKKDMLSLQITCNLADIAQYLCLGAYTACTLNTISLMRNVFFRNSKGKKSILFLVILAYLTCGILTYDTIFSAISILIVIIQTLLAYQNKEQYIRIGAVFIIIYWIFYDCMYGAYVASVLDCIILVSNVLAVFHYKGRNGLNTRKEDNVHKI